MYTDQQKIAQLPYTQIILYSDRNPSLGIFGIIPWEKFQVRSALYNSEFFLRKIGVLLWIFRGINLGKIPRKFSDIYLEKFRHILGKIPTYSRKNS
jgi:hypothetical protein